MPVHNPVIDDAPFVPLVRTSLVPLTSTQRAAQLRYFRENMPGATEAEIAAASEAARKAEEKAEVWASEQYTVLVYRGVQVHPTAPVVDHLSIRRDDREPIRDWRHMQAIKNQICGRNHEGIELYPAEARLVDTANQYHIWVFADPNMMWPVGWTDRLTHDDLDPDMGAKQRPGATSEASTADAGATAGET